MTLLLYNITSSNRLNLLKISSTFLDIIIAFVHYAFG